MVLLPINNNLKLFLNVIKRANNAMNIMGDKIKHVDPLEEVMKNILG